MNKSALHLWFARPDDLLNPAVEAACSRLLCEQEHARWKRYKFESSQREFLATHALARIALSSRFPTAPDTWRFKFNPYGKPSTDPDCGLQFNLSNSKSLVVCLISESADVGVDVEPRTRAQSVLEVAPRMFSPIELAQMDALPLAQKPERALSLWTLKEAYIKARGMGLALPTNKFSFVFDSQCNIQMEIDPCLGDSRDRWQFSLLEHLGHCIALMVESESAPTLHIWDAKFPELAPSPSSATQPLWFPIAAIQA